MDYIIRDHDRVKFEHKKELFAQAAGFLTNMSEPWRLW